MCRGWSDVLASGPVSGPTTGIFCQILVWLPGEVSLGLGEVRCIRENDRVGYGYAGGDPYRVTSYSTRLPGRAFGYAGV